MEVTFIYGFVSGEYREYRKKKTDLSWKRDGFLQNLKHNKYKTFATK